MLDSRGSSRLRDRTRIFYVSCLGDIAPLLHMCHLGSPWRRAIPGTKILLPESASAAIEPGAVTSQCRANRASAPASRHGEGLCSLPLSAIPSELPPSKWVEAESQGHAHSLQTSVPLSALTLGTHVHRRVSAAGSSPTSVVSLSPLTWVSSWILSSW